MELGALLMYFQALFHFGKFAPSEPDFVALLHLLPSQWNPEPILWSFWTCNWPVLLWSFGSTDLIAILWWQLVPQLARPNLYGSSLLLRAMVSWRLCWTFYKPGRTHAARHFGNYARASVYLVSHFGWAFNWLDGTWEPPILAKFHPRFWLLNSRNAPKTLDDHFVKHFAPAPRSEEAEFVHTVDNPLYNRWLDCPPFVSSLLQGSQICTNFHVKHTA